MAVVGYILLGILLFVLALLLLILFVPIRYQVQVTKDENALGVKAKVHWLLRLIRVIFDYPEPKEVVIKIAFFTLGKGKKKGKEKKKAKKDDTAEDSDKQEDPADENAPALDEGQNVSETNVDETGKAKEPESEKESEGEKDPGEAPDDEEEANESLEEDTSEKSKDKKNKKAKKKFDLQKLKEEYEFYKGLWEEKDTKPFIKDALGRILHILKNLFPRKIKGRLRFGAATPDVTGYACGGYHVLKALYPKRIFLDFQPEFDEQVLEAQLLVKGHFTIFILVYDALRLLLDKRLKKIKKALDQHKETSDANADDANSKKQDKTAKKNRKKTKAKTRKEKK